jgi:hypothetical protein
LRTHTHTYIHTHTHTQLVHGMAPWLDGSDRWGKLRATMAAVLRKPPMQVRVCPIIGCGFRPGLTPPRWQPYIGLLLDDVAFAYASYDTGTGVLSAPGQQ